MEAKRLIRVSGLRNRPVICQNRQTGFVQSLALNAAQTKVDALIVARGMRGKCTIPASAVQAITPEFILASHVRKYERRDEQASTQFVRDTSGLLVGRVSDYAVDEETLQIEAIEILRGYLPGERKDSVWLFSYAVSEIRDTELTVPVFQGFESIDEKEESACAYPR